MSLKNVKKGDILINHITRDNIKVLGIYEDILFLSFPDDHSQYGLTYLISEAKNRGYKIKEPEPLKFEIGKFYLCRNNNKCILLPSIKDAHDTLYFFNLHTKSSRYYLDNGQFHLERPSELDIISLHPNQTWEIE